MKLTWTLELTEEELDLLSYVLETHRQIMADDKKKGQKHGWVFVSAAHERSVTDGLLGMVYRGQAYLEKAMEKLRTTTRNSKKAVR